MATRLHLTVGYNLVNLASAYNYLFYREQLFLTSQVIGHSQYGHPSESVNF